MNGKKKRKQADPMVDTVASNSASLLPKQAFPRGRPLSWTLQ